MPLLRTRHVAALFLLLAPFASTEAQAAPAASKKPPPAPLATKDPRLAHAHASAPAHAAKAAETAKTPAKPTPKAAPAAALKNVKAGHGATANLAPAAGPHRAAPSTSVGSPTEGHLIGGAHLADAPYLRIYPSYSGNDVRWGVDGLVGLVDRAAKNVRKQFSDAVLSVGHLSKRGGGELDRHASHESGRDADIGFYVKNAAGKPIYGDHMVAFNGEGTASSWPGAHFDEARNWALVASIVGDGHAHVTHMFVATPIRERLLAYAAKIGASPAIRSRAAEVLAQPHGALPHDDHFHVRIACPSGMDKCVEQPLVKRRQGQHGSAVASHGHAAHPTFGAGAGASSAHGNAHAQAHAAPATAHGSAAHAAPPAAPPTKPATKPESRKPEEEARSESLIPSFAPAVPGLDSAVIPTPLAGVRSTWGTTKEAPPPPKADPVSDPDGVLEKN